MGQPAYLAYFQESNGRHVIQTNHVAELVGRQHSNVMHTLRQMPAFEEYLGTFIFPTHYRDASGRKNLAYALTFTGFAYLVSGFSGSDVEALRRDVVEHIGEGVATPTNRRACTLFSCIGCLASKASSALVRMFS